MDVLPDPSRRTTRSALAEIPVRLGLLRVTPLTPPATPTNNLAQNLLRNTLTPTTLNVSDNNLSPVLSPDELVIQQRGRRRIPVTWSPDNFRKTPSAGNRTPQKSPSKLNNTIASLRTTPRKRILLSEQLEVTPEKKYILSPTKRSPIKNSPIIKRSKLDLSSPRSAHSIDFALKGLSNEQLVDLIKGLVDKHPDIEEDLKQSIPTPDIKNMEEKLNYLKRNIFKSIPSSRLTSRTDSQAYSRAVTHLTAFKKCLLDQVKVLNEGQHWDSLLDYACLAWNYVRSTPLWDNHAHNTIRRICFKNLASQCLQALKSCNFDKERSIQLYDRFRSMSLDCEDVLCCAKFLETRIVKFM